MDRRIAIVQSSYIPWKGYFDLIAGADEFVLLDEVQYTRRDWRNRNLIRSGTGVTWLTIPVNVKGRYHQRIDETTIADRAWASRHWQTIAQAYRRAPHFALYEERLSELYARASEIAHLSHVNRLFIDGICELLGVATPIRWSTEFVTRDDRVDRLLDICIATGATRYLSGPSARTYLDEARFAASGVGIDYMDYTGYPEYEQLHPGFEHGVTVIDLLLNAGPDAHQYMKMAPAAV